MEELLKSKPTLTPLAAGAVVVTITGTLSTQLAFPGNWTALSVSFLLGLFIWAEKSTPAFERVVLYLVNSLTIFTMAMGINSAGVAVTNHSQKQKPPFVERGALESKPKPFFHEWF